MEPQVHVLVADDDPISRTILEKNLKKHGYRVTCVKNGKEALEAFDEIFFPVLLTDWMMPEMDGLRLCRAIRETITERYVFIVLLTAKGTQEDIV